MLQKSASENEYDKTPGELREQMENFSGCVLAKGFKEGGKVAEYNLLTQALLAAGYTVDQFPDQTRLGCPVDVMVKAHWRTFMGVLNMSVDIVIILSTKQVAACM